MFIIHFTDYVYVTTIIVLLVAEEGKEKYLKLCVPLHKAALKGDWKVAKQILDQDPTLVRAAITKGWATVLHVAAGRRGADHVHFVEELVKIMSRDDLELQDKNGNTAFSFAAATGNMHVVEILKKKNDELPLIRGCEGTFPRGRFTRRVFNGSGR